MKPLTRRLATAVALLPIAIAATMPAQTKKPAATAKFDVMEATIDDIHAAMKSGRLTAHELVQDYLDRIAAYNKQGPQINCIITTNPVALAEADRLDAELKKGGFVGPLHGIPLVVKDQVDVAGMPTTLGSVVFKDYMPPLDATAVAKLKDAGAIILGKATLGEFGAGDSYGSLYGATRNPYDPERTAGGSSGGSGACVSANFSTIAMGEEGFASIRRPGAWNMIVSMRPSPGLVGRAGLSAGYPSPTGQLGPMARNVHDLAMMLDSMVGCEASDPQTGLAVGQRVQGSYTQFLKKDGLKGARIGILRTPMGRDSESDSEDFRKVAAVFETAVKELEAQGVTVISIEIPMLKELMATRTSAPGEQDEAFANWLSRNPTSPYKTGDDIRNSPHIGELIPPYKAALYKKDAPKPTWDKYGQFLVARDKLNLNMRKVMADNKLDAIVFKTVEHSPTLIKDGLNPPYTNEKGATSINTFLIYTASMTVPAGMTVDKLPVGITFFGPSFTEPTLLKFAYAYEQATHHRIPPPTTPNLK